MKPKIGIILISLMIILQLASVHLTADQPEEQREMARIMQESTQICGQGNAFKAGNLCREAEIRDNINNQFKRSLDSPLISIIDDNPNTFYGNDFKSGNWLEIKFPGARRWVNFIEIQSSGKGDFDFEIFDFKGNRTEIVIISTETVSGMHSDQIMTLHIEPLLAKGIRLSFNESSESYSETSIYEISAWFHQSDPDRQIDPDPNDPDNWLLVECIRGMGISDTRPLWDNITGLNDWCPTGWHYCHWWRGQAAWDGDFTRSNAGGYENSHTGAWTGMDYHDLSVVALHGSPCNIYFPNPNHIDGVLTAPGDVNSSWGNRDAEWFCALSCSPFQGACKWDWARGFNGAHLQCGFTTTAWATNGAFLGGFASYLISSSWVDPAFPIPYSWFMAKNLYMSPIANQPVCAIVLADDSANDLNFAVLRDYLWGQGLVHSDPNPPRGWVIAIWDPPVTEKVARYNEHLNPVSTIDPNKSYLTVPSESAQGVPVKVGAELYAKAAGDSMIVYGIEIRPVNMSTISSMAASLCDYDSMLCFPAIGQDSEGNWWAVEDEHALWANPDYGVIQYGNMDEFIAQKDEPPLLPTPQEAIDEAFTLLSGLNLLPMDSFAVGNTYYVQQVYDLDYDMIIDDYSYDLAINADFYRYVEGLPVFGPGGYITVTFGEGYMLQEFTCGSWPDLQTGRAHAEPVISEQEAIDMIAMHGEQVTIGGIPPICDTLVIDSSEQAYYSTNGEYETDILEPIYHFFCHCISAFDTVECEIFVPNRESLLRGSIDNPIDGSIFMEGELVEFEASATGGVGLYTFDWYSDIDGYLGQGEVFGTDSLTAVEKEFEPVPHNIQLIITDDDVDKCVRYISIYIEQECYGICGDANGDETVNVSDAVYIINYVFVSGPLPVPLACGDANSDGTVNVSDAVYIINYVFVGGGAPEDCSPGSENWIDGDCCPFEF
jgi:hypothetical protein